MSRSRSAARSGRSAVKDGQRVIAGQKLGLAQQSVAQGRGSPPRRSTPARRPAPAAPRFEIAGLDSYQGGDRRSGQRPAPRSRWGSGASVQPDGPEPTRSPAPVVSIGLTPDTQRLTGDLSRSRSALPARRPPPCTRTASPTSRSAPGGARGVRRADLGGALFRGIPRTVTVYLGGPRPTPSRSGFGTKGLVMTRITPGLKASQHVVTRRPAQAAAQHQRAGAWGGPGIGAVNVVGPPLRPGGGRPGGARACCLLRRGPVPLPAAVTRQ